MLEGDENSSYFHSTIRKKNILNGLKGLMIDKNWCEDMKIKELTFEYLKTSLKKAMGQGPLLKV